VGSIIAADLVRMPEAARRQLLSQWGAAGGRWIQAVDHP
jgi:hypothetical protein